MAGVPEPGGAHVPRWPHACSGGLAWAALSLAVCVTACTSAHGPTREPRPAAPAATEVAAPARPGQSYAPLRTRGALGRRPNIVVVLADDHAFQALSAYDDTLTRTPNIDRIAEQGVRFDRAMVTNSVCGPSRAALLTGTYSHVNGFMVNLNQFDRTQPTFVTHLHDAGYQTALIGKWHLGSEPRGFDHYEILDSQGRYYNPPMRTREGETVYEGYVTDIIADRTARWLREQRDPGRPFLLLTWHKAPHRRWEPALRHLSRFDDRTLPEPATLFEDLAARGAGLRQQDMTIAESLMDRDLKLTPPPDLNEAQLEAWEGAYGPKNRAFEAAGLSGEALVRWKYQRFVKDYLRTVAALDEAVGGLLDTLAELDLERDTVVVYGSDQGFYLGEHGLFDKRFMYEPSLRTPLLMRWPRALAGPQQSAALVSLIDLAPTFLELAGAEVPARMQGQSLLPLLSGQAPEAFRETFYYHYYEHPGWHYVRRHYGVTDGRYKLMHFYEPDVDAWELYDLARDPDELHDVYADPDLAEVRARLHAELKRLREELDVPAQDPAATRVEELPPRLRAPLGD